jgi:hypothetical protein
MDGPNKKCLFFIKVDEVDKNLSFVKNALWENFNFYRKSF